MVHHCASYSALCAALVQCAQKLEDTQQILETTPRAVADGASDGAFCGSDNASETVHQCFVHALMSPANPSFGLLSSRKVTDDVLILPSSSTLYATKTTKAQRSIHASSRSSFHTIWSSLYWPWRAPAVLSKSALLAGATVSSRRRSFRRQRWINYGPVWYCRQQMKLEEGARGEPVHLSIVMGSSSRTSFLGRDVLRRIK